MIERRYFAHSEGDRHTVKDMVDRYIETEHPNQKRRQVFAWWVEKIGGQPLSLVTTALITEQRDLLRKGVTRFGTPRAPATVNRYLAYLSALFSIAVREWQWVQQNPVQGIKKLQEAKGRVRYLHKDEIHALLAECEKSKCRQIYPFTLLALSAGARAGELLDLLWSDVDFDRGLATIHDTKNGERRAISVKGKALEALAAHQKVRRINCDRVFFPAKTLGRNTTTTRHGNKS